MLPNLSLILGGAASGKSVFAEHLAVLSGKPCLYIATARADDREMRAKIAEHRARRGDGWRTIEAPRDVSNALAAAQADEVVLFDCVTLWLTNQLSATAGLKEEEPHLFAALKACAAPVILVSNELGQGTVPDHAMTRAFRQAHGELNQRLATRADLVVNVVAGLPSVLKGVLPAGVP